MTQVKTWYLIIEIHISSFPKVPYNYFSLSSLEPLRFEERRLCSDGNKMFDFNGLFHLSYNNITYIHASVCVCVYICIGVCIYIYVYICVCFNLGE